MIFVTGDTHGDRSRFQCREWGADRISAKDQLVICGDFGYLFTGDRRERDFLDSLEELPYQVLFLDGNHENFDLLNTYPVELWNGGKVHIIKKDSQGTPKVIHLMRGQVYEIQGKKIFTFGGAYSIDRWWRQEGISWWSQEMPTEAEMQEGIRNLEKNQYRIDYIFTHAAPEDTMNLFYPDHPEEKRLNNFLEWVREKVAYQHWYFGHLHEDRDLWRNQTVLWYEIRNVETNRRIDQKCPII